MLNANRTCWSLLTLTFLWCAPSASAEDRRFDKSHVVVMTFNAEFMWDGVQPEEGQVNFAWKGSKTEEDDLMSKIADIINEANPDSVNLVEVGGMDS